MLEHYLHVRAHACKSERVHVKRALLGNIQRISQKAMYFEFVPRTLNLGRVPKRLLLEDLTNDKMCAHYDLNRTRHVKDFAHLIKTFAGYILSRIGEAHVTSNA